MTKKNIPTEEEFARASAILKERSRGLSQVRENILTIFGGGNGVHEFFILGGVGKHFTVYIFYQWDREIKEKEDLGFSADIIESVFEEMDRVGRGNKSEIKINFEFDSNEVVQKKYKGNYYNRLR